MFLDFLLERNPALADFAAAALASGAIAPDSYVLDLDAVEANADRVLASAAASGVSLYFMSKQVGRNPELARRVLARRAAGSPGSAPVGFAGMVAVDFREAEALHAAGLPVRHVGHLVQVPEGAIDAVLDMEPEVVTVYSVEKAASIARRARAKGREQALLLRVCAPGDVLYPGQEGGFATEEAVAAAAEIGRMDGVRIEGVTAFPCFLHDPALGRAVPTPNARTAAAAAELLRARLGLACPHVNMPSCNSPATIPLVAELGGTHAEPGHSLTGTNPDNPGSADPLMPAMVYATEVSHRHGDASLCYGGGHYRRSNVKDAAVLLDGGMKRVAVEKPDCESIDYHFRLRASLPVGAPVVMAFRAQIFVTRSRVVLVEGLSRGRPAVVGTWDSQGRPVAAGGAL